MKKIALVVSSLLLVFSVLGCSVVSSDDYSSGYDDGYNDGIERIKEAEEFQYNYGHVAGWTEGFDEGKEVGYDEGYSDGLDEGAQIGIMAIVGKMTEDQREDWCSANAGLLESNETIRLVFAFYMSK